MYGYFRPFDAGLSGIQERTFHAYYCRLCYCLRLLGGQAARYLTTFDAALCAIILAIATKEETPPFLHCQKVGKSNMNLFKDDERGLKHARLSYIGFGEKIRDDIIDDNSKKAAFMKLLFGKQIESANQKEPELWRIAYEGSNRITELQSQNAELDEVLDVYGDMMAESFARFADLPEPFKRLYRNIGRWTLYVDMLSDYDDDYKNGSYNSFKREDSKTLSEYFDKCWHYVIEKNREIGGALMDSVMEIQDGSVEWTVLYRVVGYALDTVVPRLLAGEDVRFHYFKEFFKNLNDDKKRHKKIERERKEREQNSK